MRQSAQRPGVHPRRPHQAVGHREQARGSFHPGGRRRRATPVWAAPSTI